MHEDDGDRFDRTGRVKGRAPGAERVGIAAEDLVGWSHGEYRHHLQRSPAPRRSVARAFAHVMRRGLRRLARFRGVSEEEMLQSLSDKLGESPATLQRRMRSGCCRPGFRSRWVAAIIELEARAVLRAWQRMQGEQTHRNEP